MKKLGFPLIASLFFSLFVSGQNDPVLLTIENEKITKSEFLAVYNKNNVKEEPLTEKNVNDYMELFINYKLKVKEAEALGLDTSSAFKNELAGYRKQLAQPYLSNREVTDQLLQEAYDRSLWDLRASHILIRVSPNASPADTLAAYKKAMDIRKKIASGASFEDIAVRYSEDESVKDRTGKDGKSTIKGNRGDLGFFSVLNLYYEFETTAYNMKVGELSMPVRTPLGYHIIKVTDRRPAIGKVQAAHILIRVSDTNPDSSKARIEEAYNKIMTGASFEDVAKEYSDDKGSAVKGGVLPWFGSFRISPDFVLPLYDMKPGETTQPIRTEYGWHIIKLLDHKPVGTFEESKSDLKMRIGRDKRSFIARDKLVARLKDEYHFSYDEKTLKEILPLLTDSIYSANCQIPESASLQKTLCTIAGENYTLGDFATYLQKRQSQIKKEDDRLTFVKFVFGQYSEDKIVEYENGKLEEKYPEFKALMKEYRDGILLFDLMDKNVWSKAVKDTSGLQAFYETIKTNYQYGPRAEACLFTCTNDAVSAKLQKLLKKAPKKGYTPETIASMLNTDTILSVTYQVIKVEKGVNAWVDQTTWVKNQYTAYNKDNQFTTVWILSSLSPEPKPLQEVKGLVTAEYQNYLEQKWVKALRSKYSYKVNEDVLKSIYSK